MKIEQRIEGAMWGLLVGDAVGVPYEFHAPSELPAWDRLEVVPPSRFKRAHPKVPPGTWSDDGAHALCLLDSLLERGRLDLDDLGRRLSRWYEEGLWAVDGVVFDVGFQTGRALGAMRRGVPAERAGGPTSRPMAMARSCASCPSRSGTEAPTKSWSPTRTRSRWSPMATRAPRYVVPSTACGPAAWRAGKT